MHYKALQKKQLRLAKKKAQNFPEHQSANIPSNVVFQDKMAGSDEGDSAPVLDALPDFSTPERNSRKELEARNDWTENNDSLELTRKRMEERW